MRATLPLLDTPHAAVVVTSSIHALLGFSRRPAYAAAKGAVLALVRQLSVDYAGRVRFNAVVPGAIETGMWRDSGSDERAHAIALTPVGRIGRSADVAAAVAFLASDAAAFITGQHLVVDGGRSISAHE